MYTSISCSSTDTRIEDCYLSNTGYGSHSLDVGVKCQSGSTMQNWPNFASLISLVVTIKICKSDTKQQYLNTTYGHETLSTNLVLMLEKHPIRTSYPTNTVFWLDNFLVRVQNLYSKVLWPWGLDNETCSADYCNAISSSLFGKNNAILCFH